MTSKVLANARGKKMVTVVVTLLFALMLAPRDPALFAGPYGAHILPTMISGISFGMAIMLLIDLVRGFGDKADKAIDNKGV